MMSGCLRKLNSQFMCLCVLENQLKVREKSVKSQGILFELTAGNPEYTSKWNSNVLGPNMGTPSVRT